MSWNDLDMKSRSDLMELYLKHGITSLDAMKEHYNSFATGGHLYQDGGSRDHLDAISGPDRPNIYGPIEFLTDYVNSKSFEEKAPDKEYVKTARSNVKNFEGVLRPNNDFGFKGWWHKHIPGYYGPRQNNNRIYFPDNDIFYASYPDNYSLKTQHKYEDILSHEFGHQIDPMEAKPYYPGKEELVYTNSPKNYNDLFYNKIKGRQFNSHDWSHTENYADLQNLRWLLFKNKIFDARSGDVFTKEHLEQAKKKGIRKDSRLMQTYDDNIIIEMLNTIAQNNSTQDTLHYTAKGGFLGHTTPYGQWQYPHQVTTIPSNNITMKEVDYPVLGVDDLGNATVMQPDNDYVFEGNYVTEYPLDNNVLAAMPVPLPPNPIVPLDWDYMTKRNANGYKDMQDMWNYMISNGVSERNAAALMGNIMQESSFDPNKVQKGGDSAVGYFQMHGDKLKSYNNWLKANKRTHSNYAQVDYILDLLAGNVEDSYMKEYNRINDTINTLKAKKTLAAWEQKQLQEYQQEFNKRYARRVKENRLYPYSQMIEMFNNPDLSIEDVTDIFTNSYERAGKPEYKQRQQYARDIYERFRTKKKNKK